MTTAVTRDSAAGGHPSVDGPILRVRDLHVSFPSEAGVVSAVRGVDFDLHPGRTLAIVGESGSGKSVTSLAVMGLLPDYARVSGSVEFRGEELIGKSDKQMSRIRGAGISMIFQDPLSALTPVYDIGTQLVEAIQTHRDVSRKMALERAVELLDLVGIPEPEKRLKSFPHEFSGGMRQRVVIAIAIANNPSVIIADEPTTALDVTIQAQILNVIKVAQRETGAACIMITHDMGVVANIADDVLVMYGGRPVEKADVHTLFRAPRMPYSIGLLGSTPRVDQPSNEPLTYIEGNPPQLINVSNQCQFAPRCPAAIDACLAGEPPMEPVGTDSAAAPGDPAPVHEAACVRAGEISDGMIGGRPLYPVPELPEDPFAGVPREEREVTLEVENLNKDFPITKGALVKRRVGTVHAVKNVSFDLRAGECLAIVGESGSGKTTTLLEIMDLQPAEGSRIVLCGEDASTFTRASRQAARRNLQMVFQDPMSSLNPRMTVKEILEEPLDALGYEGDRDARITELMDTVGLDASHIDRFPGHFSGGQRQRIGLARALATNPSVIVLDEPVSALDVSIQAGVINLLESLKRRLGLSYLFVAHDLSVVRHLSDRVAVMYKGDFVEFGDTDEIFDNPRHPYTRALLSAIPVPDPDIERDRVPLKYTPEEAVTPPEG